MSGVNDLAKRWDNTDAATGERYMGRVDAAADLVMLAETAWKPVSDPPTEADGDSFGEVLISDGEVVGMEPWDQSQEWIRPGTKWARVKDVLLMPPQGGE